jgi:putative NADPH-quinone reductase
MMKHVLILNGNPDPGPDRLTHALADAYRKGAEDAGCVVRHINIGDLDFPILRNAEQFATYPREEAIIEAREAFLNANHIVILYPLWLGGPPALLKAYMEQIGRDNFLLGKSERGFPAGRLKGRSARVIVTMGMPALIYRLWYGAHGVKAFNRSILNLAGIRPVATSLFGGVGMKPGACAAIIEKVRKMGRKLA